MLDEECYVEQPGVEGGRLATTSPSHSGTIPSRSSSAQPSATLSVSETQHQGNSPRPPRTSEPSSLNSTIPMPPPPKRRTVRITTSVLLPNNEAAATVVLSTAGASGAVASTLGSSGAGVVVTAGASVRMMECGLAEDDPRPARFELPIQFPIGSGTTRYFAGAALGHTLLQCLLFTAPILLHRRRQSEETRDVEGRSMSSKLVTYVGMMFCGAHAFFTPAILGACSTVLVNDEDSVTLAVAGGSALVVIAIHVLVVAALHFGPRNGLVSTAVHGRGAKLSFELISNGEVGSSTGSSSSTTTTTSSSGSKSGDDEFPRNRPRSNSDASIATTSSTSTVGSCEKKNGSGGSSNSRSTGSGTSSGSSSSSRRHRRRQRSLYDPIDFLFLLSPSTTKEVLLALFDGCRTYEKNSHRHYASIEISLYSVISIISGARPKENCSVAALAVGICALIHLLYIMFIRPFRTRLDTGFSLANALLLVVLSMSVAVEQAKNNNTENDPPEWTLRTIQACLWLISVMSFVQLAVQLYWAYHVQERRKLREKRRREREGDVHSDEGSSMQSMDGESGNDSITATGNQTQRQPVFNNDSLLAGFNIDVESNDGESSPATTSPLTQPLLTVAHYHTNNQQLFNSSSSNGSDGSGGSSDGCSSVDNPLGRR